MAELPWQEIDDRYYQEELRYLLEAGREYARMHPERARFLHLEDSRHRDPHVERLIEAVAFLTGRVHRRLDDDFPELTHSLLRLIWPHYLRPVPPLAMLELDPLTDRFTGHERVPAGCLVDSKPTSAGVPCRFRTGYPVDLYPIRLQEVGVNTDEAGRRFLNLGFELTEGADPAAFRLDRLRLYLAGEPPAAFLTYWLLRRSAESVALRYTSERSDRWQAEEVIRPVGLGSEDELLPYPRVSFPGYRLLSEYFAFPEKYLFIDFVGLGSLARLEGKRTFNLEVRFKEAPPDGFRPTTDDLRLYVTPIVNLFPREGEPIQVTHVRTDHKIQADYSHPEAYEVISVEEVMGLPKGEHSARKHVPFFSFKHEGKPDGIYYQVSHGLDPAGRWSARIGLVSPNKGELPKPETLSLSLSCSNGQLCQEVGRDVRLARRRPGDKMESLGTISLPGGERLDTARIADITRPTESVYPETGDKAEWRFISHMALNHLSLADVESLRQVLALYNVGDQPANRRRIEAVRAITVRPLDKLIGGAPVRGSELILELDETHFAGAGDLLVFSEVLSEFFSLYAGINSFTELVIHRHPSNEEFRCPAAAGRQSLL